MECLEYDMVVVGAGPAGSSAARTACRHGITVLLIDARKNPGSPVQCAEYVPRAVKEYVALTPEAVVQKIDTLLTFINDELVSSLAGPGYMLDRVVFDGSLVQSAREAGAEFWPDAKAISRTNQGLIVSRSGKENVEIKCRIIIGADGPRSTVGQWMNSENKNFMVGLQYNLPLCKYQSSTDIYFKPEYEGGYAWVFPKGENANVGIGVNLLHKNKLQFLIKDFIGSLVAQGKLADSRPALKTGGLIPVGGPLAVTQQENMILTGDAAGHTHPVTGGGIMNAIVTGQMAGEMAAQAVINNDLNLLSQYPLQWQSFLGRYLDRATQQRKDMD
ncbi:MAG: NAD(P)/FAD-dependent oxidoreductase, partial [Syntrophomonas sp.]|nr:NAD(P)/FAD-dependent oxidoreductase [Syntrophomonas sp.]